MYNLSFKYITDMHTDLKAIGVYDKELDLFESQYVTPEGISYNSYIIFDEKTALIDTVDQRMADEWRDNLLSSLPEGKTIDYLIVQHLEPDHSSQIEWVMERFPECRLVCTAVAHKMLPLVADNAPFDHRIMEVAEGDTLSLGSHGAPDPSQPWACEARRYYFNIVGKYGLPVQTVLKKLAGKQIDVIAPLHGPILEGDLTDYLRLYRTWAAYEVETEGVLVAYASIHGMTAKAAKELAEILRKKGAPKVSVTDLSRDDMAEAVEDAFRMSHLVVLSPTYDSDIFPPMHDFIHHLAIKGFRNRRVAIVENGLWAPAAGRKMRGMFEQMKDISIVEPIVTLHGRLTPADIDHLSTLADNLLN